MTFLVTLSDGKLSGKWGLKVKRPAPCDPIRTGLTPKSMSKALARIRTRSDSGITMRGGPKIDWAASIPWMKDWRVSSVADLNLS